MITQQVKTRLEKEIQRTKNHLQALEDLYDMIDAEGYGRKSSTNQTRVPLILEALKKIKGTRVFSVKEVTALCRRIDPKVPRRNIYNCIKGYLEVSVKYGDLEKVGINEYKRLDSKE